MALSNQFLSRLRELSDEAQPQRQVPSPTASVLKSGQRQAETTTVQNPGFNAQQPGWGGMAAARGASAQAAATGAASAGEGLPEGEGGFDELTYGGPGTGWGGPGTERYSQNSFSLGNIGRGTGFGYTPWGHAGQFSRAGSMYPTFWSHQPGMGWVPAAMAVSGPFSGMYAGGAGGAGAIGNAGMYSSSYTGAHNMGGNLYPKLLT